MKLISLYLVIILSVFGILANRNFKAAKASGYNYAAAWKNEAEYENKGLPESALKQVNEIYTRAKSENNSQQFIKSVVFILKLTDYKQEDALIKNLNRLENEAAEASFPAKQVLHSMLAEMYWNYYQSNRYSFSQRTQTVNFKNDDISTWSLEKIVEETIRNYQLSLENEDQQKLVNIDSLNEILIRGNDLGRAYRHTLYDFLAHRAVDFYMGEEPGLTTPAYVFTINSPDYLKDAKTFSSLSIKTKDSMAYKYYALKIFQRLISFHLNDDKPEAMVDVDLKRLQFVYQHAVLSNKQELYLKALEDLEQKSISAPISTIVTYKIAQVWSEKGNLYKPLHSDDHKWDNKKACEICESAIKRFPESDGAAMCFNLQQQLHEKALSAKIEKVNIPELPFRALVTYKNLDSLSWRIIKVDREEVEAQRYRWLRDYNVDREEKFLEYFLAKDPVKSGFISLPDDEDLQQHAVEIKLDAIPLGDYMVLFSPDPSFSILNNNITHAYTTISNLSFINRNLDNGSTEIYTLNRTTGDPIAGLNAQIYFTKYISGKYEQVKGDSYLSDNDGSLNIPNLNKDRPNEYSYAFFIDFSWKNDKLSTRDIDPYSSGYGGYITQYPHDKPSRYSHTFFFLDRAIYRPGQNIYFKGLLYSTNNKTPQLITKRSVNVTFYDVNDQVVAQKDLTTNEYGTFNGSFTAPSSGLTGQMRLQANDDEGSNVYFSVEEYKRPKFEVGFDTVKGSFRLGENIEVTGKALAYSGANIDDAAVKYRVVRQARFPYWWWCWFGYYPVSPEMEITNGITNTDAEGKFTIDFKAIPDESVDKKVRTCF